MIESKLVFCVIDDSTVRELVDYLKVVYPTQLEAHGFTHTSAFENFALHNKVDILLVDLGVKDSERAETIQTIIRTKNKTPEIKTIVFSGVGDERAIRTELENTFGRHPFNYAPIGTGDDADTPAMRQRAAARTEQQWTTRELSKSIDYTIEKTANWVEKLDEYLENHCFQPQASQSAKRS